MILFSTLSNPEGTFLHYTVSRNVYPYQGYIYQVQSLRLAVLLLVQGPQWDTAKWRGIVIVEIKSPLTPCSCSWEGIWRVRRFTSLSPQSVPAQQGMTLDVCKSANISQQRWIIKNRGRACTAESFHLTDSKEYSEVEPGQCHIK